MLSNTSFIIRAVSLVEKKGNCSGFIFPIQVRHKASKKVYAMKLLSKFEMVSETTLKKSFKSYFCVYGYGAKVLTILANCCFKL